MNFKKISETKKLLRNSYWIVPECPNDAESAYSVEDRFRDPWAYHRAQLRHCRRLDAGKTLTFSFYPQRCGDFTPFGEYIKSPSNGGRSCIHAFQGDKFFYVWLGKHLSEQFRDQLDDFENEDELKVVICDNDLTLVAINRGRK
jgi:hypothetical protein